MKQLIISIPGMQSRHCETVVSHAVSQVAGVQIEKTEAGKLTVSLATESLKAEVEKAITKAGYAVAEDPEDAIPHCTSGCCTPSTAHH